MKQIKRKVTLINYTKDAEELLIFSKKTRLNMSANSFKLMKKLSKKEKEKELDYVFGTIGSSWEFIDYVFMIENVTRAFTHQLVRHRVGVAFAQQAQRVVDMGDFEYLVGDSIIDDAERCGHYSKGMSKIRENYNNLIDKGANPQDARGLLPTNILTNILMKINLRALAGLLSVRLCFKAQGEFQDVAKAFRKEVLKIHPWAEPILQVHCVQFGSCVFEGYKDCPIKKKNLIKKADKNAIKRLWGKTNLEVQPKNK
jgi:flavin-dependent thymidylate synthase